LFCGVVNDTISPREGIIHHRNMTDKNEQPTSQNNPSDTAQTVSESSVSYLDTTSKTDESDADTHPRGDNVMKEQPETKKEPGTAVDEAVTASEEHVHHRGSETAVGQGSDNSTAGDETKDVKAEAQAALSAPKTDTVEVSEASLAGNTTNDIQKEVIKVLAMKAEQARLEREKAEAEQPRFTSNLVLRLDIDEASHPMLLTVSGDLVVGRADNVTDYVPEIDLTPHGAYRLGLSRRHALIRMQEGKLVVKDLGSRNGTYVNGIAVQAGTTQPLKAGDELRFGNLAMRVSFESQTS